MTGRAVAKVRDDDDRSPVGRGVEGRLLGDDVVEEAGEITAPHTRALTLRPCRRL